MTKIDWTALHREAPTWFSDAKFGLFFHWGPYSVPAFQNEWYSRNMYAKGLEQHKWHVEKYGKLSDFGYKDFYPGMTGDAFCANQWAELVKRSGAKYAGPVTEHADNFSLWDSKVNPINSVNYGPKRDIVAECAEAFRKKGIKFLSTFHHQWLWGWFMSDVTSADVYDPANEKYYWKSLPLETNRYIPYRLPDYDFCNNWLTKIKEVVEAHKPEALYFDSRTNIINEQTRFEMAKHYYTHVPNGIITYKQNDIPEHVGVLDIERGHFSDAKPFVWQTDDRLEDNVTWCMVQEPKYRTATSVIRQLCDIVSKNGVLLLNVGPYANGSFHKTAVETLHSIGDWLQINGEAIYETRPWYVAMEGATTSADSNYDVSQIEKQTTDGLESVDALENSYTHQDFRFTKGQNAVYAIALGLPCDGKYLIKSMTPDRVSNISKVTLLGYDTPLTFERVDKGLLVNLPGNIPGQHAWTIKIEGDNL